MGGVKTLSKWFGTVRNTGEAVLTMPNFFCGFDKLPKHTQK